VPVVFDTNVWVSAAFFASSKPSLVVRWAIENDVILASPASLSELARTLERPKFDQYATRASRHEFVAFVHATVQLVSIARPIRACRDANDDKFLEVAANGGADALVTGDADLLVLDPFEGIPIVTPSRFLAKAGPNPAAI
jgi:putative PIN family toxin of toxin-antitoxin system